MPTPVTEKRQGRADMTVAYKIMRGREKVEREREIISLSHNAQTHGRFRKDKRKFFMQQIVKLWNLQQEAMMIAKRDGFKREWGKFREGVCS